MEKTLRLVFARSVQADAVADALAERLEPKARRRSGARARIAAPAATVACSLACLAPRPCARCAAAAAHARAWPPNPQRRGAGRRCAPPRAARAARPFPCHSPPCTLTPPFAAHPFPRLQLGKASPALKAFKAAFAGATIARGTVITLSAGRGGKLTPVVAGAPKPAIASPELCRALFDIYLGSNPVSLSAKESFGAALAAALTAK